MIYFFTLTSPPIAWIQKLLLSILTFHSNRVFCKGSIGICLPFISLELEKLMTQSRKNSLPGMSYLGKRPILSDMNRYIWGAKVASTPTPWKTGPVPGLPGLAWQERKEGHFWAGQGAWGIGDLKNRGKEGFAQLYVLPVKFGGGKIFSLVKQLTWG